jgi:hypothetical protein
MFKKLYNRAMEYKYRFIIYLVLLALTIIVAIWLHVIVFPIETPQNGSEGQINASQCMVGRVNIPYYPELYTLATLDNEKLIDCLIYYESKGNEEAVNPCDTDGRPKYGLLQFDTRTFKMYCVDKYNLPNDIFDSDIQKTCCDNMISDGLARHWGTLYMCLK